MKREWYENFLAKLMDNEENKGAYGVNAEVLVRDALMAHGIDHESDMRARLLNQTDCVFRFNGKMKAVEVKTGAGALFYGDFEKDDLDTITEEDIFPNMDYVVFGIDGKMINEHTFKKTMVVFTREQFAAMLTYTGKHGLRSSIRLGRNGAQIQMQEWKTKTCEKRYAMFWNYVEENEIPDLETFLEMVGRG